MDNAIELAKVWGIVAAGGLLLLVGAGWLAAIGEGMTRQDQRNETRTN